MTTQSTIMLGDLQYVKLSEIYDKAAVHSKQKANKMLTKPKKPKEGKPFPSRVSDNTDYTFEHEEAPVFLTDQNFSGTYIAFSVTPYPAYLQEEKASFRKVFDNILFQTTNHQYFKKLLIIRSSTMLSPSAPSMSKDRYLSFVKDLGKLVYKEYYDKRPNTDGVDLDKIKELEEAEQKDQDLLSYDLFNPSTLSIITSLYEVFDKLTDDEIENCVFLSSHSFIHPYNWLLSPAALALSFFHSQLMFVKKPYKDDLYYSKHSLPSVTYISLTGIYSEMDIDMLHTFSDNIQTIIIYDEITGGPVFSKKGEFSAPEDLRRKKRAFQQISNKLLLVPLQNSKKKKKGMKDFSPNDLLWLFENIVLAAIEKFRPTYVVLNCSFTFDESNNTPFLMDTETMSQLINLLKQVCDNKIVVFPFKLPNQRNEKNADLFKRVLKQYAPENQKERLQNTIQKYGVPYDELQTRDIFLSVFEALAGLAEQPTNWDRLDLMRKYKTNVIMGEVRYCIAKQYKEHAYYKNLYSNSLGVLSRIAQNETENINGFSLENREKTTNKLALFYPPENDVKIIKLKLQTQGKEILLNQNSQYFVDYKNQDEPKVYIFNAKACEINNNLSLRVFGPLSHFELAMETEDTIRQYSIDDHEYINLEDENLGIEPLKDSGLAKCGDLVFQVYGTSIKTNQDSTKIYYFNFKDGKHYELKLKNTPKTGILPRHGVTACAFIKDNKYYLYVFGGKIKNKAQGNSKEWGTLDIVDIVEIYSTTDPKTEEWEYKLREKDEFTTDKGKFSFIPYYGSYAYYLEEKDKAKIILMGGKMFERSVYDWTFPVFEYNIETNIFDFFSIWLNDSKNNTYRPKIDKNEYKRPVVTAAIADKNKNFYYDAKTKTFKFVIPRQDELFVTLYSFQTEKPQPDAPQIVTYQEIEVDNEENATRIAPPSLNKDINPRSTSEKKVVNFDMRTTSCLNYVLNSVSSKLAEYFMLEWRVIQKEEVSEDTLKKKFENLIQNNQAYIEKLDDSFREKILTLEEKRKNQEKVTQAKNRKQGFQEVLNFMEQNQAFKQILTDNDTRIDLLRKDLADIIIATPEFEMSVQKYNAQFEKFLDKTLNNIRDGSDADIFQVFQEAQTNKHIYEKMDSEVKKPLLEILDSLIKVFSEAKPLNLDNSRDSTRDSTRDTTNRSNSSFFTRPEEASLLDNSVSFKKTAEYLENRPSVYKFTPSNFMTDYVGKNERKINEFEKVLEKNDIFLNQILHEKTKDAEPEKPLKVNKELRDTLEMILVTADRIALKLKTQISHALKIGAFIPPPSIVRFELFIILLKRLKRDIELGEPCIDTAKDVARMTDSARIINQSLLDSRPTKVDLGSPTNRPTPPIIRHEEVKQAPPEQKAQPTTKKAAHQDVSKSAQEFHKPTPTQPEKPKVVCVNQEVQTDQTGEGEIGGELEREVPDVKIFLDNLTHTNNYQMTFNAGRSELLIIFPNTEQAVIKRLRFKIYLKGINGKKGRLEDLSFESSPSSITIFESNVIAYVDQNLKIRHSDVYNRYKACVLYADLKTAIESLKGESEAEDLVFRKLFLVGQDDHIQGRCLLATEESLFLFGGRSYKFKGKASVRHHNEVALYFSKKMESVEQNSSDFKDSQIDVLSEKGEMAAIYCENLIYVVKRSEPSVVEVFNKDGTTDEDENIEIPSAESLKGYSVKMNLVNFRGKEEILFAFYCRDKDIKFMLLDVKEKEFEKANITLIAVDEGQEKEKEKLKLLYTGFEEIEASVHNVGVKQLYFYSYRGDVPEVTKCEIKIGS